MRSPASWNGKSQALLGPSIEADRSAAGGQRRQTIPRTMHDGSLRSGTASHIRWSVPVAFQTLDPAGDSSAVARQRRLHVLTAPRSAQPGVRVRKRNRNARSTSVAAKRMPTMEKSRSRREPMGTGGRGQRGKSRLHRQRGIGRKPLRARLSVPPSAGGLQPGWGDGFSRTSAANRRDHPAPWARYRRRGSTGSCGLAARVAASKRCGWCRRVVEAARPRLSHAPEPPKHPIFAGAGVRSVLCSSSSGAARRPS